MAFTLKNITFIVASENADESQCFGPSLYKETFLTSFYKS